MIEIFDINFDKSYYLLLDIQHFLRDGLDNSQ